MRVVQSAPSGAAVRGRLRGGADGEVRVWDLEDGTESKSKFRKLRGRKAKGRAAGGHGG